MNNASLELGGTNWAEKDASLLGYTVSDDSGRFSPQEFTFARGSNLAATRIGKTGLIEKGRENLLTYSNDFSNGTWAKSNLSVASSNGAWEVTDNTTSGSHYIFWGGTTPASSVVTLSIEAKAGAEDYLAMRLGGFTYAFFNLSNGTLGSVNGAFIDAKIEATSDGFYKCSATINTPSSGNAIAFYPSDNSSSVAYTGTGAVAITIKDAQLEQGLVATPYIETTTTSAQAGVLENTPRLNYTTGVADPYLLLEPSRTNFTDSSEYAGGWAGINANITKTDNATTSPEGVDNAVKLEGLTTSSTNQIVNFGANTLSSISVVGKTYTASVYLKPVNPSDVGDDIALSIQRNSGDYEGLNVTFEIDSADWKRYDLTYAFTGAGAGDQLGVSFKILRSDTTIDDIYVYGVQLEEGSYLTSYIPTYSVSATRAQDDMDTTFASPISTTGNVSYLIHLNGSDFQSNMTGAGAAFEFSTGDYIAYNANGSAYHRFRVNINSTANYYTSGVLKAEEAKVLAVINGSYMKMFVNGQQRAQGNLSGGTPELSSVTEYVTSVIDSLGPLPIKQILLYPTALTDTEAITLTTI